MNDIPITRDSPPAQAARYLLAEAAKVYRKSPQIRAEIAGYQRRLDEPLRVALVGSVKAGKSTLLNGLLGQYLAPTDARECTRVVTWYRHGNTPTIDAYDLEGGVSRLPVVRQHDRLELELGELEAESLDRLEVTWPAEELEELVLIDTPGTVSISANVSGRTHDFLVPREGVSGVDAVVYMLRSLHKSDVDFLNRLHARRGHGDSALGSIAVLSRADELGGGRLDAMVSVVQAVRDLRADPALEGLVESIVPVVGLLALAGSTLRQSEFTAFVDLQAIPRERLNSLLMSADRFIAEDDDDLPSAQTRARLVERFGLYGIRLTIAILRSGISDAPSLSAELVRRSGLDDLRSTIDLHFRRRSEELKAHSAVQAVQSIALAHPTPESVTLLETVQEYLVSSHAFREMRLLSRIRSEHFVLPEGTADDLIRLIGGYGTEVFERVGCDQDASAEELTEAAFAALWRWNEIADHPLVSRDAADASRVAIRTCEGLLATIDASAPQRA